MAYQTLASVAGAPHVALSWASSASVVASLVSSSSPKPGVTGVAPASVSLPGGRGHGGLGPQRQQERRGQHSHGEACEPHGAPVSYKPHDFSLLLRGA